MPAAITAVELFLADHVLTALVIKIVLVNVALGSLELVEDGQTYIALGRDE